MISFKQFLKEQLLYEMPKIDHFITKDGMREHSDTLIRNVVDHKISKKAFDTDEGTVHTQKLGTGNDKFYAYYHQVNGKIREVAGIDTDHIQHLVDKGDGGNSKHIASIMKHHVDTHGQIISDNHQSVGGKNLWKNLISDNSEIYDFFHIKHNANKINPQTKEYKIDKNYINKNENTIWGDTEMSELSRLKMSKK